MGTTWNKLTLENRPFVDTSGTYTATAWAIHSVVDENIINPRLGLQSNNHKGNKESYFPCRQRHMQLIKACDHNLTEASMDAF